MKRVSRLGAAGVVAGLVIAAGGVAASAAPASKPKPPKPDKTVEVQVLGLNDFHGALEPIASTSSGGRIGATPAGGAEYLATHVDALRATNPRNTIFVSAGDLIGATPLVSALFHDEPTIEAFNLMGLDYNGVGNHEFDEGVDELLRMQRGGCHPVDGCQDGDRFRGADFDFLAANVTYKKNGRTIFPPYKIHTFSGGVKAAIIGMTLEGTPTIVTPSGISTVNFLDEAATVNALIPKLRRQGVETFIVLLHEGGAVTDALSETTINNCTNPTGALPPIVAAMDDAIDVVVTGHTNWAVNCNIDGKIVTGAAVNGRLITDIDLTISKRTGDVVGATVNNKIVTRDVALDPEMTALIAKYKAISAPLADRVIGTTTGPILRLNNAAGESALGDVIADSQLLATTPVELGGAQLAFMNPGGIRGDLNATAGDTQVTYGEIFTVQPFGNSLVTMTLTGAQIERVLEQQFRATNVILQVSNGFAYTWDGSRPAGDKVDPATITLNGTPLDPVATYRVTVNNFLATGGDGFTVLTEGTNLLGGDVDLDALEKYFDAAAGPVAPGPQNRITGIPAPPV